jgi:hypothetical protein
MKRTPWILASLAAFALTACGPRPNAAGGGAETGATADTAMTAAPAPTDTGMAGTDTTKADTTGKTGTDTAAH